MTEADKRFIDDVIEVCRKHGRVIGVQAPDYEYLRIKPLVKESDLDELREAFVEGGI